MKTNGCIIIIQTVLALAAGSAFSADVKKADAMKVCAGVQKRYQSEKNFSAAFMQRSKIKGYPMPQVASGRVYFTRPDRMRWDYEEPEKKHIVSDGKTLWMYMPSLEQAYRSQFALALQSSVAAAFLSGMADICSSFKPEITDYEEGRPYRLVLTPVVKDSSVERLTLFVDPISFTVEETELLDPYGNINQLIFTGIDTKSPVEKSLYDFTPPEGTNIIDSPNN